MSKNYYKACAELDECNNLIEKYWYTKEYDKCFKGHMKLALRAYPLAECQVGYFYLNGYGCGKDYNKAFYWTKRAANHGDKDAMNNLSFFYSQGIGADKDLDKAEYRKDKAKGLKV